MKYILVTGGVISGIGKGVVASSVGVILKQVRKIILYISIMLFCFCAGILHFLI